MFTGMPEGGAIPGGPVDPTGDVDHLTARARSALVGTRFADVRWAAETGSTNADALALAREGAPEGVVVVADHQTAGRGRRDRRWVAPPGGSLLVSVLLRPRSAVAGAVAMAAGVAMVDAVDEVAGVRAGLKWPNDLVVDTPEGDRKLAGLLAEADWPAGSTISGGYRAPEAHDRAVVVVGVGVNVAWPVMAAEPTAGDHALDRALDEVAGIATALNWRGAEVDRVDLLVAFLRRLDERYGRLVAGTTAAGASAGGGATREPAARGATGEPIGRAERETTAPAVAELVGAWRERSATLGRRVRVDLGTDDVEGTAVDVTGEGHLVVDTLEGERRTLAVGDVVHLRTS
jgi:BirA family biotin operon repressor/biotin-[acetyl-CoA-carboxylase] ligase